MRNELFMGAGLAFSPVRETRQISGENPDGKKGGGCRMTEEEPLDGGCGLKVHPFISLQPGETKVLADIAGAGCIREMFFTTDHKWLSELVLRIFWDDETAASVEMPLGMFFANGFDDNHVLVNSAPIAFLPRCAMNCYWEMPFAKRARITLTHEGQEKIGCIAYRILYHKEEWDKKPLYFHAQYRRSMTTREKPVYTILDGVRGMGKYVGTYLAWNAASSGWWGEGEVKFYLDGDDFPSIADNGCEDYFGGSFGFSKLNGTACADEEVNFCTPCLGMPLALTADGRSIRKFGLYRWHLSDYIGFLKDIRVTVDTLGWWRKKGYRPLPEEISSMACWYQQEPHETFPVLPAVEERWDR